MRVRVKSGALAITSEESPVYCLTENCEYFVLGIDDEYLRVIDDYGEPILYPKNLFEILETEIPPGWLFHEGDEGDYYIDPRRTAMRGFYEAYFGSSGDTEAQLKAHAALRATLEDAFAWGQEADRLLIKRDMERLTERQKQTLAHPGRRWP